MTSIFRENGAHSMCAHHRVVMTTSHFVDGLFCSFDYLKEGMVMCETNQASITALS